MKKVLILMLVIAIALSLAFVVSAAENEAISNNEAISRGNLKSYIEDRVIPIIIGVVTSVVALLGTLKGVMTALKGLKESKAAFDKEQAVIKENSKRELENIAKRYKELEAYLKYVPDLDIRLTILTKQIKGLEREISNLSEMTVIGLSDRKELVMDGKMREIVRIANKNKEMAENEIS